MINTANLQSVIDAGRRFASKDEDLSTRLRAVTEDLLGRTNDPGEWPEKLYPNAKALFDDLVAFTSGNISISAKRLGERVYDLVIDTSSEIAWHHAQSHQMRRERPTDN